MSLQLASAARTVSREVRPAVGRLQVGAPTLRILCLFRLPDRECDRTQLCPHPFLRGQQGTEADPFNCRNGPPQQHLPPDLLPPDLDQRDEAHRRAPRDLQGPFLAAVPGAWLGAIQQKRTMRRLTSSCCPLPPRPQASQSMRGALQGEQTGYDRDRSDRSRGRGCPRGSCLSR